jgi:hypothetical protein
MSQARQTTTGRHSVRTVAGNDFEIHIVTMTKTPRIREAQPHEYGRSFVIGGHPVPIDQSPSARSHDALQQAAENALTSMLEEGQQAKAKAEKLLIWPRGQDS